MKLVIVTGMSGAGKSTAMKMMEDMGFFCVDNLPIPLLGKFVDLAADMEKVALCIDARNGEALDEIKDALAELDERTISYQILFLDAEDEVLVKRYKETRRSHPLAPEERVDKGIALERQMLTYLKEHADYLIDTSHLLTRELLAELEKIFIGNQDFKNLVVTILSFGFKYGIPRDADLVIDVRFLPNPFYVEGLRTKTGNDPEIQDFVMQFPEAETFLDKYEDLLRFLIPNYISEGKTQLVIAVGCTGGRHRSVTLANELYKRLDGTVDYGLKIEHRDLEKDPR